MNAGIDHQTDRPESFARQLAELRRRLIICAGALAGGASIAFLAYNTMLQLLLKPYCSILPAGRNCTLTRGPTGLLVFGMQCSQVR